MDRRRSVSYSRVRVKVVNDKTGACEPLGMEQVVVVWLLELVLVL